MRWSGLWWLLVLLAAVMILESNGKAEAAPSPQAEDEVLNTLLKLDRMYSSAARPR